MANQPPTPENKPRFLVIDDDPEIRKLVTEYLYSFGYPNVLVASDAFEALNLLKIEKVDFIISDWQMPGLNGLELLKIVRDQDQLRSIPFILITSPSSGERVKLSQAICTRVDDYLMKPFRGAILKERIEKLLNRQPARSATQGVLVIDDDEEVRSLIKDIVNLMGFSPIFEACDGQEGLEQLRQNYEQIALVISDWEMPKLQGIDLLKQVRADEELSGMPFLMCTSQTSIERDKLSQAIEAHVDHYLMKPFSVNDLKQKIQIVLDKAQAEAKAEAKARPIAKDPAAAEGSATPSRQAMRRSLTDAERLYKGVLRRDPENVDAHLGLAATYLKHSPLKSFDDALTLIKRAIHINPNLETPYLALALAFETAMSLEKAIQYLKEGAENCPDSEKLHFHLGRVLIRRGRVEPGIEALQRALALKPDHAEALVLLEETLTKLNEERERTG